MAQITVENIETPAESVEAPAEPAEPPEPAEPAEPSELQPVAFETASGSVAFAAAPKRRGRPKAEAVAPQAAPKAEPKKRGRPPKPRVDPEPAPAVAPAPEPPPVDINALLAPLMQAYMASSHMQQRQVKAQRNREMVRSIFSRQRQNLA